MGEGKADSKRFRWLDICQLSFLVPFHGLGRSEWIMQLPGTKQEMPKSQSECRIRFILHILGVSLLIMLHTIMINSWMLWSQTHALTSHPRWRGWVSECAMTRHLFYFVYDEIGVEKWSGAEKKEKWKALFFKGYCTEKTYLSLFFMTIFNRNKFKKGSWQHRKIRRLIFWP